MVTGNKIICQSKFDGMPKITDFSIVAEELGELSDGDVLLEMIYWSVDPYMRVEMPKKPINSTMIGENIGIVIETRDPNFPTGSFVWSYFGWRDYVIFNNAKFKSIDENYIEPYVIEPIGNIPLSAHLGVFGTTGMSAYFGLLEICKPKAGETIVVSGAGGAVGTIVGQIGKILNCRVIGIAGGLEKYRRLQADFNFDAAIDYKGENLKTSLEAAAPNGIDIYFDNVGGEISSTVMSQMNNFGRVSLCGAISTYNLKSERVPTEPLQMIIIEKQLKVEGFNVTRWIDRWGEAVEKLAEWIRSDRIKFRETCTCGFLTLPVAFIGMLQGKNIGKALVEKDIV